MAQPVFGLACICATGALWLLSGCTMIPKYERPPAPVASQFPTAKDSREGQAADLAWRSFFADERLRKLIECALANNRDLRVAMLNVEQSRAQYRITRSALFPSVDGIGSYTRAHANGVTGDTWSASLGSTAYEVDLWGRVRSLNRQALEKYLATEEAKRGAQITLIAEVASQYFWLRESEEQIALARRTFNAVEESHKLNQATFDAGAINELDLRTSEAQVRTARINVVTYERQLATAQNALVLLLGQTLPGDLPPGRAFGETNLLAQIPAGLPSELIQNRPDILQAEHTLKAANANIGAARAAFFPTITLTGSLGTTSSQFSQLFGAGTGVWSFSPQVTLPIFTGGKNRADLDAAKVATKIEVATYEKAIQTAFRELADALVANETYAEQIQEQAKLVTAQQRRYELANARYRQGEDDYLTVLSAQQDLYAAEQKLLDAQFSKLNSQITLYQALGGGWK